LDLVCRAHQVPSPLSAAGVCFILFFYGLNGH